MQSTTPIPTIFALSCFGNTTHIFCQIPSRTISACLLSIKILHENPVFILNTDDKYFDGLVSQVYPSELQLNKANSSETEAHFLDLRLFIYFRWAYFIQNLW